MTTTTFIGILTLLEELKVKKVYISEQTEKSTNYNRFLELTTEKNIKVQKVIAGNRINIEQNLYLDVIWPTNKQITTNILNNNSIVCNLHYKKFSMLFTGDIEEIAEKEIIELYSQNKNLLKADILKAGHHGSKTSSSEAFLNLVKPKATVIGVGKNNNFGHPNEIVLERIKNLNAKIYRTDLDGEISITVNNRNEVKIKTQIKCD